MRFRVRAVSLPFLWLAAVVAAYSQAPVVNPQRVQNSASFATGQPMAPGSLVSIFGSNFASGNTLAQTVPLSTSLANVTVTFNNVPAPLLGVFHDPVNGDQINAQMPWEVTSAIQSGTGTASLVVTAPGGASAPVSVPVTTAAAGIFAILLDSTGHVIGAGTGQAIAYGNLDYAIAAPAGAIAGLTTHPAKIGDPATLAILATGLGPVNPPVATGNNANDGQLHYTVATPTVLVGNVPAQVVFSGMSPLYVGVYQLNIVIQPGTPTGNAVPLQIQMNGITSTNQVTIAVSQ